jgi:catechol 2,3-dioxygenase-like lactoylglutathione lyase family enzyme
MLRTSDEVPLDEAFPGLVTSVWTVARADGSAICDVAEVDGGAAGCEFRILRYAEPLGARYDRHASAGLFAHGFPALRIDHLGLIPPDFDAATRFWTRRLGLPLLREVRAPGLYIRQVGLGGATLDLLAPDGPGSHIANDPHGLVSIVAVEVPDLAEAVAVARGRGFHPPDPAPGALPGTRTANIPAHELGGLGVQLLEYV